MYDNDHQHTDLIWILIYHAKKAKLTGSFMYGVKKNNDVKHVGIF